MALQTTVRQQFEAGRHETDEAQVEAMKANAVRALSNYMLFESGAKDGKVKKAMIKFDDNKGANEQSKNDKD